MIDAMNSGMSMPPPPRSNTEQSLTEEQQSSITEILSSYDVDNLSESDAASIVESFAELGIQPGVALEEVVSNSGFDAKTIGELAGVEEGNRPPPPPPPPQQSAEEITSMVDYLAELMEEKLSESDSDSLSTEDKESILAQVFDKYNIDDGESIINTTA